ncbi:hypothetical protein E1B28_001863 [Marasmius oreades]|uniref:Uncharacterized protein n=1 Tax=Marasmius oreades TaxID=181124 RepID=A0A9P8AG76_9AGAR|nr:uncharacterized protein E1B28_001863 [Marasmius oreades]KAG7100080.1 hypothetical protein E1B28_001863 [Marasmius oreades]
MKGMRIYNAFCGKINLQSRELIPPFIQNYSPVTSSQHNTMAAGFTKIFGVLSDSKRRLKRRGSDASVASEQSSESMASSSSSLSTSSCSAESSKAPSLLPTPLPSPSIGVFGLHESLDVPDIDGMYHHYPHHTCTSSSSHYSQDGDIDIDADLLREWSCSPPSAQFQLKRMGRGSRGRARPRPTLATPSPEKERTVSMERSTVHQPELMVNFRFTLSPISRYM